MRNDDGRISIRGNTSVLLGLNTRGMSKRGGWTCRCDVEISIVRRRIAVGPFAPSRASLHRGFLLGYCDRLDTREVIRGVTLDRYGDRDIETVTAMHRSTWTSEPRDQGEQKLGRKQEMLEGFGIFMACAPTKPEIGPEDHI